MPLFLVSEAQREVARTARECRIYIQVRSGNLTWLEVRTLAASKRKLGLVGTSINGGNWGFCKRKTCELPPLGVQTRINKRMQFCTLVSGLP